MAERDASDHGTHKDAIDFLLDEPEAVAPGEERTFLTLWRAGDLAEYPDFYDFLDARRGVVPAETTGRTTLEPGDA